MQGSHFSSKSRHQLVCEIPHNYLVDIGRKYDFYSFFGKNSFVVRGFKMNLLEKYSTKVLLKGTQVKLQYQLFDSVIIIKTGPLVNFINFAI